MKQLLFLPIDLDTSYLTNIKIKQQEHLPTWNPFWNVSEIELTDEINQFCLQLPMIKISKIYYKTQEKVVEPHVDTNKKLCDPILYENLHSNEPAGYHVILKGSKNVLYVYDGNSYIKTTIPESTNCYVMGITTTLHKVDHDPNRITIFIRGLIDRHKHKNLIDMNLKKYGDYAVYES